MNGAASAAHEDGTKPARVGMKLAAVVLAAVALFSLGVMTGARLGGRGEERPLDPTSPGIAAMPALPAGAPVIPSAVPPERLTFYDRLSGAAPPVPPLEADEPGKVSAGAAAPPSGNDLAVRVKTLTGSGTYTVQVAAMADRAAAAAMAERLRRQGLPVATTAAAAKGRTWHRLRIGPFPSREAAAQAAGLLRAELGLDAAPMQE